MYKLKTMKNTFYYSVLVQYHEGYFIGANAKREYVLGYASKNEQTIQSIQRMYRHAKVLKVEEITLEVFLEI